MIVVLTLFVLTFSANAQTPTILPPGATITALGRTSLVKDDGSFEIFGVPSNNSIGQLGFGQLFNFRVRMIAPDGTTAQSDVLTAVPNLITFVPFLTFGPLSPVPVSLAISAPTRILTTVGQTVPLTITGTFQDGTQQTLTTDPLTYYLSSNPAFVTVSQTGVITVKSIPDSLAAVIITVMGEGTVSASTFQFMVAPPVVAITSPSEGAQYVPGQGIYVNASVTSAANIDHVDFTVDGVVANTQTAAPYAVALTLPIGDHTLGAHAYDVGGTRGDAVPVHINVIADPLTKITGIIVDANGKVVAGAIVRAGNLTATTDSNGRFTITNVPTVQTKMLIAVTYADSSGKTIFGSTTVNLIRGGVTDIGTLTLTQRSPWSKFHADTQNTGVGAGAGVTGILKWQFKTGGSILPSPAIGADGTIYIGSDDDYVYALDGQSGTLKWQFKTGGSVESSPAISADGTIYVGSDDDYVYALDGQSGALKWQFKTGGSVTSSPAISADGAIYIGSGDDYVYALDGQSGTLKWQFKTGDVVYYSCPAIGADGTIYVGSYDNYVYALNGRSGALKWKFKTNFYVASSPAIGPDGTIYVGSDDDYIYALDGQSGTLKWQFKTGDIVFSSPAIGLDGDSLCGIRRQ